MDTKQFRLLHSRLRQEGSFSAATLVGLATVLTEAVVSLSLIAALLVGPKWLYLPFELMLGVALFHWFVIVHECGHGTFVSSKILNDVIGHWASAVCLVPYTPWKAVHAQHHYWTGVVDKDPTQSSLLNLKTSTSKQDSFFRFTWATWLPLPFLKFLWDTYWLFPARDFRSGNFKSAMKTAAACLLCLATPALLIVLLGFKAWLTLFAPAYLIFLFIIENVTIAQHAGYSPYVSEFHPAPVPYSQQDAITRSTHLPPVLSVLLFLNFNRHVEHHLFPVVPWFRLNRLRSALHADGYTIQNEVAFPDFIIGLRRQDPLEVYRASLPKAPSDI